MMIRKIIGLALYPIGVFLSLWALGAIIASDFIVWCTRLPFGLGLPLWMTTVTLATAVPFGVCCGIGGMILTRTSPSRAWSER